MLIELEKRIDINNENFDNKVENIKKIHSEMNNLIDGIKSTLEGMNNILSDTEECISDLKDRIIEIN